MPWKVNGCARELGYLAGSLRTDRTKAFGVIPKRALKRRAKCGWSAKPQAKAVSAIDFPHANMTRARWTRRSITKACGVQPVCRLNSRLKWARDSPASAARASIVSELPSVSSIRSKTVLSRLWSAPRVVSWSIRPNRRATRHAIAMLTASAKSGPDAPCVLTSMSSERTTAASGSSIMPHSYCSSTP